MTGKAYKVLNLETMKTTRKAASATTSTLEMDKINKDLSNVTDEDIMGRLRERFSILDDMTRAVKKGDVRAMIVTGPPGVGKSFGVEKVLAKHDVFATVAQNEKLKKYEVVKGAMSAIGLYKKLYEFSDKKRMIHWNTDSRLLRSEGVPNQFEFKGGAIFITNIKFEHVRSKKLQDHLAALESRCHYLDLTIDTDREKLLRIRQVVSECGMLDEYEFSDLEKEVLIDFIDEKQGRLRELSLRMVLKLADLKKSMPGNWRSVADVTCMRRV